MLSPTAQSNGYIPSPYTQRVSRAAVVFAAENTKATGFLHEIPTGRTFPSRLFPSVLCFGLIISSSFTRSFISVYAARHSKASYFPTKRHLGQARLNLNLCFLLLFPASIYFSVHAAACGLRTAALATWVIKPGFVIITKDQGL